MGKAKDAALRTTSILDVPDDLLELVLLRVGTPACLLRAAATCKPWLRVAAGAGLLRRFCALHDGPRLLLGHYCVNAKKMEDGITRLHAEFVPLAGTPRPANRLRQRLSLDFLPRPPRCKRALTDTRGGLLAFVRDNSHAIVCDPWTRQYRELQFPWDQHGSIIRDGSCYHCIGAFLLDADGDGSGSGSPMSSFMVLCACLVWNYTAHACVFSARNNRWIRSYVSNDIVLVHWTGGYSLDLMDTYKRIMGRAGGSIFWYGRRGHVLALDENTGDFSTFVLPAAPDVEIYCGAGHIHYKQKVRVVGGGGAAGAALRIVCVVDGNLEVFTRAHGGGVCMLERRVGLCQLADIEGGHDRLYSWRFVDTDKTTPAGLLELGAFSSSSNFLFSLDVETMKLQRLDDRTTTLRAARVFPYEIPWPQKISACLGST
ncbi:unnamed protein product [Urochloa decumbens]|uniref:F-box domain-containing protein n=1 Tax=Urochloa decumbens TaxID=240449 RepID=A0ABC8VWX6_9POAL